MRFLVLRSSRLSIGLSALALLLAAELLVVLLVRQVTLAEYESYLRVLFEGDDDFFPALGNDDGVKFWFNCGPQFFPANSELGRHWRQVENLLQRWRRRLGRRFRYKLMSRGDSFLVH